MALAPLHPCSFPGCAYLIPRGKSRCAEHAATARPTARQRGYDRDWERLRAQVLAEEPYCRVCSACGVLARATDVDHITAKRNGGPDVRSNLQGLCHRHHSAKTAAEVGWSGAVTR